MSTIGLVLGKPAHRSPVIADVLEALRAQGYAVRTHVPSRSDGPPTWLGDADLVALRGLEHDALTTLAAHARDGAVRFLDAPDDLLAVRDRARTAARLTEAGLATPAHWHAVRWRDVEHRVSRQGGSLVVKHVDSTVGRGARVWLGPAHRLPERAPFAGPYHLERDVSEGRTELKVYRVGAHLAGFALRGGTATPTEVDDRIRAVALRATDALGLSLAGLDLLVDPATAFVIDVNAFPSCRRLPDAVTRITHHLATRAGDCRSAPRVAAVAHEAAS
jgi:glutathione synthase/RimK-type ligase-like ATP-grasp enzyme